jgi:Fe-S cluster assembly protein SufD
MEEWKYTDLNGALSSVGATKPHIEYMGGPFSVLAGPQVDIVDGVLSCGSAHSISRWDGVDVFDLGEVAQGAPDWVTANLGLQRPVGAKVMGAASLALMRGGLAIRVRRNVFVPEPVLLALRTTRDEVINHSRILIVLEEGADLTIVETHYDQSFNVGVEIALGPNARLTHIRLADAGPSAIQVEEIGVSVGNGSSYFAHCSQLGAKLSRLEFEISLDGEGAQAELSGASVLSGTLHADVTTHIDHAAGNTTSRQLFKKLAADRSRAIYQGKVTVRPGANGSDSRQTAKALVLGSSAEADLKPELEILADDVKCAHGAAVGDLDQESLFYLRSRGIPEADARMMLVKAFLEEPIAGIARESIRAAVRHFVECGLDEAMKASP